MPQNKAGEIVTRQQEQLILRLWKDWCGLWPELSPEKGAVRKGAQVYDPTFDLIPVRFYKKFYMEAAREHPSLKGVSVFEVIDVALNQTKAPEGDLVPAGEGLFKSKAGPSRAGSILDVADTKKESDPSGSSSSGEIIGAED